MPKTPIKSRLQSNKHKPKNKQKMNITKSNLPPNLQTLDTNYYQEMVLLSINELRRFSVIR